MRKISVDRSNAPVVRGVGFDCDAASWTGIIGSNGSGKTTLLRGISGRLPISSGEIWIDGDDVSRDRPGRARRLGFAPDVAALPTSLTGFEVITMAATGCATDWDALVELRAALGIDLVAPRRIASMSAGMRQRIAIYCALVSRCRIVILDEPFNWLDPVCTFDTKRALARFVVATRCCLITALHDLATLTVQCDAGLLLAEGRLRRIMTKEELRKGGNDLAVFEADMIEDLRT